MPLSQERKSSFQFVSRVRELCSELAFHRAMTQSRPHVKKSNVRHTGQNAFIKHARKPNFQEHEHSGNPTFNPRTEDQSLEHLQEAVRVQLVKKVGMPIPRISRKLASIKVRTRALRRMLVQTESSARQFAPRSQEPSPDAQLGNPSNLVNELLFFGYTFLVVPYQAICGFPPRVHSCRKQWKGQGWYVASCFLHD